MKGPWEQQLSFALDTAQAAGELILAHAQDLPRVAPRMKALRDPVTAADIAAERLIVTAIRERWPSTAIFAEEETRDADRRGLTWYVDPLDGTVNFSQSIPFFAVSIALYDGDRPLLGVVHAPRLGETFAALAGAGSTLNGRALAVSRKEHLIDAVLATGFAYRRHELSDNNVDHFAHFVLRVRGMRRCGSAALDLAYTAAGRLDGYWEAHLNAFDVAAGAVLVQEAGGLVSDLCGGADWLHGGSIVAANESLHGQLLQGLARGARP